MLDGTFTNYLITLKGLTKGSPVLFISWSKDKRFTNVFSLYGFLVYKPLTLAVYYSLTLFKRRSKRTKPSLKLQSLVDVFSYVSDEDDLLYLEPKLDNPPPP